MFVKQIRCVLASAATPVAQSPMSFLAGVVPLNVRVGRALAVAAVFAGSALVAPANAGDLTIADPGNVCSWSLVGSTLTCTAAGAPAPVAPPVVGSPSANTGGGSPTPAVPAAGGAASGAGWGGTCPGYSRTIVMNFNYVADGVQRVQTSGGMSSSEIMVVTFRTPATIAGSYGANGTLGITDNAQNSGGFKGALSTTPCTLDPTAAGTSVKSGLLSASWSFNTYKLKPDTQYFLNITGDSSLSVKLLGR